MDMKDQRKNYLNGLSRTKLQGLAKKCPGVKANWKSQTIRERLLDPIYDIEIPSSAPSASAGQNDEHSSVMVKSAPSTRSSTKRKRVEASGADQTSKKPRSASMQTTSVSASSQPGLAVPPRRGRSHSRGASAGPTSHALTTTSGSLYDARDGSLPGDLGLILEDDLDEAAPTDYNINMHSQQKEAAMLLEHSILNTTNVQLGHDTHEHTSATNPNAKRPRNDDDDIQPRSSRRFRLEDEDTAPIPSIHKGKARMTAAEYDAWKWDEHVQWILELINRGRKDQAIARARKLQEHKERQKRIELAQNALLTMMHELGSDFGFVLSSTLTYWTRTHAC